MTSGIYMACKYSSGFFFKQNKQTNPPIQPFLLLSSFGVNAFPSTKPQRTEIITAPPPQFLVLAFGEDPGNVQIGIWSDPEGFSRHETFRGVLKAWDIQRSTPVLLGGLPFNIRQEAGPILLSFQGQGICSHPQRRKIPIFLWRDGINWEGDL